MIAKYRKLFETGFFHIVGAGSVNKVLSVILSVALVRILSKVDYGCYAYAFNIASFFILFNGLGVCSALLQMCCETGIGRKTDSFFAYGYKAGIVVDVVLALAMIAISFLISFPIQGSNRLLLLYCFYPLFMLMFELKLTWLRILLMNKEYAFMTNMQTVFMVVFSVAGALLYGATGLVIGQCCSYLLSYVVLCVKNPFRSMVASSSITKPDRFDFWKLSIISAFNNGLGQALSLIGTLLIGLLLASNELVASYKVATTIPFALLFIPGMIMTYAYPYFARNKDDRRWTLNGYRRLIMANVLCMAVLTILVVAFAEPLTMIIFGSEYLDSVSTMQLLMIGFFITAAIRQPSGNLLVTQRKLLWNTVVGVLSIFVNVVANLILVTGFGMLGAALAFDLTMLFGAVANTILYLRALASIPESSTAS